MLNNYKVGKILKNMGGKDKCKQLDGLIRDYIKKENFHIAVTDETPEFPWRHYLHKGFQLSTEPLSDGVGIYVTRGEDPLEGYCAPPLFSVSQPEDALVFFDYFVKNHQQFLYQTEGFQGRTYNYFNEEELLEKIENELKLNINKIPQRLDFRNVIEVK